jgi:PAS domain S-box-containing protein
MWFAISVYSPQKGYFVAVFDVITARKLAEERLQESRATLKSIIDNSNSLIYLVDTEGRFVIVNRHLQTLLSLSGEQLIGQTREVFLPKEIADTHRKNDLAVIKTGNTQVFEEENIEPDGKHFYLTTKFPLFNDQNEVYGVGGLSTDITERKLAEDALRESEDKFKYVFDHSVAGKSITFPSGEIHVNKAFCEMTGYSPEELTNAKWKDISYPDDIKITEDELQSLISGGKDSTRFIKRYIHKNGDIIWADVGTAIRRNEDGKPLYFMTTAIDITVRKRTEESLRLKNFVFDDSIAANSISDINGILTEVNAAFLRIWGYQSKDEVIGKSLAGFVKSDADANKILIALAKEGEWEGDYWALRKDGSTFIAHGLATLVKDEKGNGIGYQSAVLDVTDAKRTEERIKNQLVELKRFNGSMVDREIRMIQLKKEINAFCNQLNLPEKYSIPKVKD